jgi:hypothetical protein
MSGSLWNGGIVQVASPHAVSHATPVRTLPGWRTDAARLAGQLLCSVSPQAADEVLDLRSALLDATISAESLLRTFFQAKLRLEDEHYLLFFRLRRVLEPSLGLKSQHHIEPIDFQMRSVSQLVNRARQAAYEHDLTLPSPQAAKVSIEWRLPPVVDEFNAA